MDPFLQSEWIYRFSLLLIVAVGVSLAYRSSHFNFGMSGQMALGAFVTVLVSHMTLRQEGTPFMLLAGLAAVGTLFVMGLGLGFLAYRIHLNEFLSTWMLSGALIPLLEGVVLSSSLRSVDSARLASFALPWQFSPALMVTLALSLWGLWVVIFYKTKYGLALRFWATDRPFVLSLGFRSLPFILAPMGISMALMGLAGFLLVSSLSTSYTIGLTSGWDILSMSASLMVFHSPLGIIVSALFLSYLLSIQDLLSLSWGWGIGWAIWIQLGILLIFAILQAWLKRRGYAP
jgi:simple sugar transport system permease protein